MAHNHDLLEHKYCVVIKFRVYYVSSLNVLVGYNSGSELIAPEREQVGSEECFNLMQFRGWVCNKHNPGARDF